QWRGLSGPGLHRPGRALVGGERPRGADRPDPRRRPGPSGAGRTRGAGLPAARPARRAGGGRGPGPVDPAGRRRRHGPRLGPAVRGRHPRGAGRAAAPAGGRRPGRRRAGRARCQARRRPGPYARGRAVGVDAAHGRLASPPAAGRLAQGRPGGHHRRLMTESVQDAFSGTRPVDPRHALDAEALDRWMTAHVDGYAGPVTVRQFKGGQSNPTYELTTPTRAYVLRRKPPGVLLPSAHAVDREFRVISALHARGYPVARPWALCEDPDVLGSMFYVMDKVEGRVLWDLKLPDMRPEERRAIYEAQTDALAALHRIDPDEAGLGDYGRPGNYFARQVARWSKQYAASETHRIEAMDRLIDFLPQSLPPEGPTRIVHGDFRLDNLILAPDRA